MKSGLVFIKLLRITLRDALKRQPEQKNDMLKVKRMTHLSSEVVLLTTECTSNL